MWPYFPFPCSINSNDVGCFERPIAFTALKTLRMGEAEDNRGYHFRGTCTATAAGIEALSALTGLTELNLKGWLHAQAMQTLEARVPALHALCVADKGDPPVFDWLL